VYQQLQAMESNKAQEPVKVDKPVESGSEKAPVIAVYSPKGGTGTSAIAANLAVALHQAHGDTVLMDGSLQFGDILVHLDTKPARTVIDLVHEGRLEADLIHDIVLPHVSGVKLLLAPVRPELADTRSPQLIKEIVHTLQDQFSTVVLDTASKLTDVTLAFLEVADYVLVVITPELPSIKSAKLFLELAAQLEFDLDRIAIVINRANIPGRISTKRIRHVLKLERLHQVPYDTKMYFNLNNGKSVCLQEPGAPSSAAIFEMAEDVWDHINSSETLTKEVA
jgi:pilus assembly protein CpaE